MEVAKPCNLVICAIPVRRLWALARRAMEEVDSDFARKYTAVAFTCNFTGSPHIDTQNTGPFYGLALGDFSAGGGALAAGQRAARGGAGEEAHGADQGRPHARRHAQQCRPALRLSDLRRDVGLHSGSTLTE